MRRGAGDPEVEDARYTVNADQDVLRRDVAMHEAERRSRLVLGLVRRVEPVEHVGDDRDRDVGRDAHAAVVRHLHEAPQRLALDVVEDEEELVLRRDDVERRDHVLVPDPRDHPRFVDERGAEVGIVRELRV